MSHSKNKIQRYKSLFKIIRNWRSYLWYKAVGFPKTFEFDVQNFERIGVPKNMFGPFRETFLDDVYFKNFPKGYFDNANKPIILDIGANVGFFSLATFAKFPTARIYAFEPHPFCFETLKKYQQTFRKYDWLIHQKAVSNQNSSLFLNTTAPEDFTTTATISKNKTTAAQIEVKSIRLDEFLKQEHIGQVDLIKLDCEGSEYAILYALSDSIFKKIKALTIETHQSTAAKENLQDLVHFLKQQDYQIKHLDEDETGYIWAWR